MQFPLILVVLVAAGAATVQSSAVLSKRATYNVVGLRLYSVPDCAQIGNQGEWTIHNTTEDLNTCLVMTPPPSARYLSIVEQVGPSDPAFENCTTTVYTDTACTLGGAVLLLDACVDAPDTSDGWNSFEVVC